VLTKEKNANSTMPGESIFVPPRTQKKSLVLPALGAGLQLEVGQIAAGSIYPSSRRHLRNQTDG
jgi:hypothetical protein